MTLRVTQQSAMRAALSSARRASENLAVAQEQLATSRRINRLSDAPLDAARAHRVRAQTSKFEQHKRNLEQAQHEIEYAASTLQDASDIFVEAREICIRAADSATDPTARQAMAFTVDGLIDTLLRRANAQYNGRYVFAGTANDTQPYAEQYDDGRIASVGYEGSRTCAALDVGPRARVETGEAGPSVFGEPGSEADAFAALIELRDLLRNDAELSEGELAQALTDHIERVTEVHDQAIDAASRLGWRSTQLEYTRTTIDDATLRNAELTSTLEDADITAAAGALYRQEAALQAALIVAARLMKNTLLEYLE